MGAKRYDAVIVGAGPNGLAAAIYLAQAGRSVLVIEGRETVGGGCRSAALTLPGFLHDVCSAVHPLAAGSPFFQKLPLEQYGLEWIFPPISLAHPLDGGEAVALYRSVEKTAAGLGSDGDKYASLMKPLVKNWPKLADAFLGPLRFPRDPFLMARFGLTAIRSVVDLAAGEFKSEKARAMITGLGAHSILPLQKSPTAAFSLMLGVTGHAIGWCIPKGGSQKLVDALAEYLKSLGGEIQTGQMVRNINELPPSKAILLDITPRQILEITGNILPESYRRQLAKYRYGAGVFKIDYALSGPVPWLAPECREASTVHLGGKMEEVVIAERLVGMGRVPERPFVLVAQSSCFDPGRAPEGKHTLWAYCHLPNGCETDMTARIEAQIERFAPGFRELVLARKITRPADMEAYNPNYVGGDINGGSQDWGQLFTRPVARLDPYSTPAPNLFICSSSTPPGGGVHGMCGYWAARSALRTVLA